jgi:hypothetical protein
MDADEAAVAGCRQCQLLPVLAGLDVRRHDDVSLNEGRERAAKRRPRLASPLGDPAGDVVTFRRIDEAPSQAGT